MPLFKCSKCGCIDNTAVGNYWAKKLHGHEPMCAECGYGEWHDIFEKKTPEECGYVELENGFYGPPDGSFGKVKPPEVKE